MCIALFIGLDGPITEQPFDECAPTPFVRVLGDPSELPRPYFTKPYVYEIADEEGDACNFSVPGVGLLDPRDADDRKDLEAAVLRLDWLRALLQDALAATGELELYVGDVPSVNLWGEVVIERFAAPAKRAEIAPEGSLVPAFSVAEYEAKSLGAPGMYSSPWSVEDYQGPLWTVRSRS